MDSHDFHFYYLLPAKKMTTFTSEDRISAMNEPVVIVDGGASVMDKEDIIQMLRDQLHAQQCEINALRKALMYANPTSQ